MIQESGGWETVATEPALKPGMTDDRIPLLRERMRISGDFRGTSSDSDLYDRKDRAFSLKRMFTNETSRFWMG
ncbi:MAG: hypothetical protein PVH56_10390 [Desulfobacterales bacterium]